MLDQKTYLPSIASVFLLNSSEICVKTDLPTLDLPSNHTHPPFELVSYPPMEYAPISHSSGLRPTNNAGRITPSKLSQWNPTLFRSVLEQLMHEFEHLAWKIIRIVARSLNLPRMSLIYFLMDHLNYKINIRTSK